MKKRIFILLLLIVATLTSCTTSTDFVDFENTKSEINLDSIPAYSGEAYIEINNNKPFFTENEVTTESFERYSDLDSLGRCGVCFANVSKETMPTEERESIGMVKPAGWHTVKYDWVDGKYLYNRCHIIGFQLTGENANEKNLLTGTRSMNILGNLPFENKVAEYVKRTGNHVLYRVTPIYDGSNLLCTGELMEAYSVEDNGELQFCVFVYNAEKGVTIDYATGDSKADGTIASSTDKTERKTYVLNTNTKKYHNEACSSISQMSDNNKKITKTTIEILEENGYSPCGLCQ